MEDNKRLVEGMMHYIMGEITKSIYNVEDECSDILPDVPGKQNFEIKIKYEGAKYHEDEKAYGTIIYFEVYANGKLIKTNTIAAQLKRNTVNG